MKRPPLWKVKRELGRLGGQLAEQGNRVLDILRRYRHDRKRRSDWIITQGVQPLGPKLAVFVVFQPKGIAASSFMTLEYLHKNGFSVLVTSNAALSGADRAKLAEMAFRVIERPNFGYDFGAYRDSVLYLRDMGIAVDHLLLLNDSTWFPLSLNSKALAHVMAVDDPFYGFVYKSENIKQQTRAADHMESHFLSFRKAALDSDGFKRFWDEYRMSNSRNWTIQKGEKGISKAMAQAGFASQGMISHSGFLAHLATKTNPEVREVLREMVYDRAGDCALRDQLVEAFSDSPDWHQRAMDHFADCLNGMHYFISSAFIAVALRELNLPFIKKAHEDRFHLSRAFVIDHLSNDSRVEIDPRVLTEVNAAVANFKSR
jgi:hypothetical protein